MVSKVLVIFVVASQTSQWLLIGHLLFSRNDTDSEKSTLITVENERSALPSDATTVSSTTVSPNAEDAPTSASLCPLVNVEPADIDRFLEYNRNQSIERFRQNTFAPTNSDLFYSYLPQIWCPAMARVGGLDDGGKWLCNPWRLEDRSEPCVVYSIGVGFNLKFDKELIQNYACQVHAFDPDPMAKMTVERVGSQSIHFYPWAVVGANGRRSPAHKRISDVLIHLNHRRLDVLKVDVEGGEFDIIDTLLNNGRSIVPICQILIEVHTWDVTKWRRMFRQLERARFYMFSREVNILGFGNKLEKIAIEYSYIHEDCLEKFRVNKLPMFTNFPPEGYSFEQPSPSLVL